MSDTSLQGGGHLSDDAHRCCAAAPFTDERGQGTIERQGIHAPLIAQLTEVHRQRVDLHRAEKSMTLRIKAKCRRLCDGDKKEAEKLYKSMMNGQGHELAQTALIVAAPFLQARRLLHEQRAECEKEMTKMAKELPVWEWVESVRGFGAMSLAGIVGEAGDLSNYSTVSKFWKRMGLAVLGGERQQKKTGADGVIHGYAPQRRSLVWNLGDTMLKCVVRKVKDGDEDTGERTSMNEYGQIYLDRKAYERPRVDSDGHAHNRAKRYMEKRLLKDLWKAWRQHRG